MKTDILTYITRSLVRQRGVNILVAAAIGVCIFKIGKLEYEIKALRTGAEGRESD